MKIKLKSLIITEYAKDDKRKFKFCEEMKNDPLICMRVSGNIDSLFNESIGLNNLEVGPAYIIEDKRKLVGFIRIADISSGVLDLHYGVHPTFRKQNYGSKILSEVSTYLFKTMDDVNTINLDIRESNIGSRKCAENAKFKQTGIHELTSDENIIIYSKRK